MICRAEVTNFDISSLKLVIWDLDETFWKGTLSEGPVSTPAEHISLVRALAHKGVMNSICSKNDYDTVKKEFLKDMYQGLFDCFIFSSVDWSAKGQRIKQLIEKMQLRAENVLFIDDNLGNLQEAEFYCKNIQTATPEIIQNLIADLDKITKKDEQLSRLNQYKILEKKFECKQKSSSNQELLEQSNIHVFVDKNCLEQEDRIFEMLHRTNQLNYTKNRSSKEELHAVLTDEGYENAVISVKDDYGDYGLVGFFSKQTKTNHLVHFLFSCRILGMGVDQFLYQYLNYPVLTVNGDVSGKVSHKETVTWVKLSDGAEPENQQNNAPRIRLLMKGPCDLESTLPYLTGQCDIDREFIHTNQTGPNTIAQQCTYHIVHSKEYSQALQADILSQTPLLAPDDFSTRLFDQRYDVVVLSMLLDSLIGVYKHKENGYIVCYGLADLPITDRANWDTYLSASCKYNYNVKFTKEMLEDLAQNYEFLGPTSAQDCIVNLEYIRQHLPPATQLIVVMGCETPCESPTLFGYEHTHILYQQTNRLIEKFAAAHQNVQLVNLTDLVHSQDDFLDCLNHYKREVYYRLASKIITLIRGSKKVNLCVDKHYIVRNFLSSIWPYWKYKYIKSLYLNFLNEKERKDYPGKLRDRKIKYESFKNLFKTIVFKGSPHD